MGFLKNVARLVRLHAAASDLESQVYLNAPSFEEAVQMFVADTERDLQSLLKHYTAKVVAAPAPIDLATERKKRQFKSFLDAAGTFAWRVSRVLAKRSLQYVQIAKKFLTPMTPEDKAEHQRDARNYLKRLEGTLDLVARRAKDFCDKANANGVRNLEPEIFDYLESIQTLDVDAFSDMMRRGEVPFPVPPEPKK